MWHLCCGVDVFFVDFFYGRRPVGGVLFGGGRVEDRLREVEGGVSGEGMTIYCLFEGNHDLARLV